MKRIMSEEIADTLREELRNGRYKAGGTLPPIDSLRRRFGVGEYAVRHALQRLRDERLISLKQGIGAVATGIASSAWKGRIALIAVDTSASYFRQKLAIHLAKRFREAGWDFVPIFIEQNKDGLMDVSQIRRYAANGLDFAILITDQSQVAGVCDSLSLPYIVLNGYLRDFPNARSVIREDFRTCFDELIRTLRKRKVKTLLEFDIERRMDRSFKNQLFESGIAVRRVLCKWQNEKPLFLYLWLIWPRDNHVSLPYGRPLWRFCKIFSVEKGARDIARTPVVIGLWKKLKKFSVCANATLLRLSI